MKLLSEDAISEFQRLLRYTLEEVRVENGHDKEGNQLYTRPAWLIVSAALYVPGVKDKYELRNQMLGPLYYHSVESLANMKTDLSMKVKLMKPDQELALNTNVVIGWDNGVVSTRELEIYDGQSGLKRLNKKTSQLFNVLKTNNSYHFYAKGRAKLEDIYTQVDDEWLNFRHDGAGYIRISTQTKGPIVRIYDEQA